MARTLDAQSGMGKHAAIDEQDFTAVVLVGFGEHLYPFNEGTNVLSKALLPIGNIPIINIVLDWILQSGLLEILLIVPPSNYSALSNHLAENYSSAAYPRLNIILKKFTDGERDEDDISATGSGMGKAGVVETEGTARLLKRFRSYIKSDFVLVPCDLFPPAYLSLSSILDKHRASTSTVLTSVLYDPPEAIREHEEALLSAYDKRSGELLLLQNMDNLDEDFEVRTTLLEAHPTLSLSTRLLDAHIYVCRRSVLDLLASRRPRDLDSLKVQVIPWLVKGSWQKGLATQWSRILCPRDDDPLQKALALSTTAPLATSALRGLQSVDENDNDSFEADESGLETSQPLPPKLAPAVPWNCQVIISRPPPIEPPAPLKNKEKAKPAPEPEYLIRSNTIAGYWELNRRFMRSLSTTPVAATPARVAFDDNSQPPIHPSAQISTDSLIGQGTKIGERSSIKKTIMGRHCVIGKGAKLSGCILWDFVTVDENARIENTILCTNLRVGAQAQIKDCEFGPGYEIAPGSVLKGERLVVGQEA